MRIWAAPRQGWVCLVLTWPPPVPGHGQIHSTWSGPEKHHVPNRKNWQAWRALKPLLCCWQKQHRDDITVATGVGLDACTQSPTCPHLLVTVVARFCPGLTECEKARAPRQDLCIKGIQCLESITGTSSPSSLRVLSCLGHLQWQSWNLPTSSYTLVEWKSRINQKNISSVSITSK